MTIKSYKKLNEEINYIHYIYSGEAKILKLSHLFYVFEANPKTYLKIKAKIKDFIFRINSNNPSVKILYIEFSN